MNITREEDEALKDILVLADIAFHATRAPHAKTIRKIMASTGLTPPLTPPLRTILLRLLEQPSATVAGIVRTAIDA